MTDRLDFVLCHCDLSALQQLVQALEARHAAVVVRDPELCLTMIRAEDSLEHQEFYLGEALTTECEVAVNGVAGYGACLGEQPVRSYCIAVIDALREQDLLDESVRLIFEAEERRLAGLDQAEFQRVLATQVDFKLLEQE